MSNASHVPRQINIAINDLPLSRKVLLHKFDTSFGNNEWLGKYVHALRSNKK